MVLRHIDVIVVQKSQGAIPILPDGALRPIHLQHLADFLLVALLSVDINPSLLNRGCSHCSHSRERPS